MNPPGLPLPPTDRTRLAEFPVVPKEQLPNVLWRIYKVANEAEYFSDRGYGRWDPLAGSLELYGTCYTSTHPMGAYVEAFAEVRSLTQDDINRYALATIELPPEPRWANMVDPTIVGQWELDERISVGDDYDTCQRWGEALFAVGFTASITGRVITWAALGVLRWRSSATPATSPPSFGFWTARPSRPSW